MSTYFQNLEDKSEPYRILEIGFDGTAPRQIQTGELTDKILGD